MDRAERELLQETVLAAITAVHGTGARGVDQALAALGWAEMLTSEPADAIPVVFTALGAVNASATALDDVLAAALGHADDPHVAVLLPSFARWDLPGTFDGATAHATGLMTARGESADEVLVACRHDDAVSLVVLPITAFDVSPVRGIDPDLGLRIARVEHRLDDQGPDGTHAVHDAAWDTAVAAGQRAIAHQIGGACRTMLTLARTHAIERVQFDRPIARFQAVRHRLAETLVAVEALEASVSAADDTPGPTTAALAKVVAGRTAVTVAAHCQQVLAGTGFTTDHAFHRYLKRTMALAGLFGSADALALDLGHRMLTEREVPTLIEL